MASEFFGRQRECRFYTAGYANKMAVSVTGPRAVNELGRPVIPGTFYRHLSPYLIDSSSSREIIGQIGKNKMKLNIVLY